MSTRRIEAFFYGLFMDVDVLRQNGATPSHPRRAYVDDFALHIGQRATLAPSVGARAYGMLIALTHSELDKLYGAAGLELYGPEAVLARVIEGEAIPALCYNLTQPPAPHERNLDYVERLRGVLSKLGFPADDIASVDVDRGSGSGVR